MLTDHLINGGDLHLIFNLIVLLIVGIRTEFTFWLEACALVFNQPTCK
jgi:hypothetical protein